MLSTLWRKHRGDEGEQVALSLLLQHGLRLVSRNFRCKVGEIDLIMQEQQTLVFVEVRVRHNTQFGSAADSITQRKQQRVIRAAQVYLQMHPQWANAPCRFDTVSINGQHAPDWCRDAFIVNEH
jgi:putative endonuclease